jgi:outer membrane immunogenic protein
MSKLIVKSLAVAGASLLMGGTAAAQQMNWAGPYVGAQVGYAMGTNKHSDPTGWYNSVHDFGTENNKAFGGLRGGFNWTSGAMMYGISADYNVTSINTERETTPTGPSYAAGAKVDGLGSIRGRLGVTSGNLALHGSLGWAYGRYKNKWTETDGSGEIINSKGKSSGIVWGFGADYAINKQVSIGVDYSAYRFGNNTHTLLTPAGVPIAGVIMGYKTKVDTVGVTLNYKF